MWHFIGLKYFVCLIIIYLIILILLINNVFINLIGNFGGMCGIICGFSLISGSEIIYFILKQIILVLLKYSHIHTNTYVDIYP